MLPLMLDKYNFKCTLVQYKFVLFVSCGGGTCYSFDPKPEIKFFMLISCMYMLPLMVEQLWVLENNWQSLSYQGLMGQTMIPK
jgi:hypothetical protein